MLLLDLASFNSEKFTFLLIFLNVNNTNIPIAYSTPAKPNIKIANVIKFISLFILPQTNV